MYRFLYPLYNRIMQWSNMGHETTGCPIAASQFSLRARRIHSWLIHIVIAKSIWPCYNITPETRFGTTNIPRERSAFFANVAWKYLLPVESYGSLLITTELRDRMWETRTFKNYYFKSATVNQRWQSSLFKNKTDACNMNKILSSDLVKHIL